MVPLIQSTSPIIIIYLFLVLSFRFHYLNDASSDPEFLLRLPMTKAGVKALDTVENFLTSPDAPQEVSFQFALFTIHMEVASLFLLPDPRIRACADPPHYIWQEQERVGK